MTVLGRYLLREYTRATLAVAGVLMLIYLSSRVASLLARVAAGELPADVVFSLLFLKMLSNLSLVMPPALFVAVIMTQGRMYRDHEMAVLGACGIGPGRLYRGLLAFALPLALLLSGLSFWLAPWADATGEQIRRQAAERADASGISAGRFKESSDGRVVFYTEGLDREGQRYQGVFVRNVTGDREGVVTARSGQERTDPESGDRYLVLDSGYRYEGRPGAADYRITAFDQYAIRIRERTPGAVVTERMKGRATTELIENGGPAVRAELHARLAVPVSAVLLALLALPLSHTSPRQGRYGKLFLGILVYVIYGNLMVVSERWLARGLYPAAMGLWWVHGLVLLLWAGLQGQRSGWWREGRERHAHS